MAFLPSDSDVPIVCLLSYSKLGNQAVGSHFHWVEDNLPQNVWLLPLAIDTICNRIDLRLDTIFREPRLCAVVLVIEVEGLSNSLYVEAIRCCIDLVAQRYDFRVFPWLYGMTVNECEEIVHNGSVPILADLLDTVQMSEDNTIDRLCSSVRAYLGQLDEIRNEVKWRTLRLWSALFIARLAQFTQVVCVPIGILVALRLPFWNTDPEPGLLSRFAVESSIICGIAAFPFLMLTVFAYTRFAALLHRTPGQQDWIAWSSALGCLVGPGIAIVPFRLQADLSWIALSFTAGALVDLARRNGIHSRRMLWSIDVSRVTDKHRYLPDHIANAAGPSLPNPFNCPILPIRFPRVFISYTRKSDWAKRLSEEIHKELIRVHGKPFLDRVDIREGSNWRKRLNDSLGQANVFVSLIDSKSVRRIWPAAELETALNNKWLSGLPEIILVEAPDFRDEEHESWEWFPVFRAILEIPQDVISEVQPHVIPALESTAEALAFRFHASDYRTPAIFPSWWADLFRGLWAFPRALFFLASVIAPLTGYVALALGLGAGVLHLDSAGYLISQGVFVPILLLFSSWLGFVARFMMAARYELRGPRATGAYRAHREATIGYIALLVFWVAQASPLQICWGAILCIVGWLEADGFCFREGQRDPSFMHSVV